MIAGNKSRNDRDRINKDIVTVISYFIIKDNMNMIRTELEDIQKK